MPRGRPRSALPALVLALSASGCAGSLDMATAYDPSRPATTIPYAGVRGARQFPDYEPIGGSILTGSNPLTATPSAAKAAKPKGGSK
jgi:hypothetical protein